MYCVVPAGKKLCDQEHEVSRTVRAYPPEFRGLEGVVSGGDSRGRALKRKSRSRETALSKTDVM